MSSRQTKNDIKWEQIFTDFDVLNKIQARGRFIIDSKKINAYRESRLMAKIDHKAQLPTIFAKHKLSILPISRGQYVIGRFNTYLDVDYSLRSKPKPITIPAHLESINYSDLYSEQSALLFAHNSGIIEDLLKDRPYFTLTGRMGSEDFNFNINDVCHANKAHYIEVSKAQLEIDAGFETRNCLALVEAKNQLVNDFNIRQLYYPYRLWEEKVQKPLKSILMTFSNDIFSFFVYEFTDSNNYNSIKIVDQQHYSLFSDVITGEEIKAILAQAQPEYEPKHPFPQANSFERLIDLLGLLYDTPLNKDDITLNYEFAARQSDYYTRAGMYLGLITCEDNQYYGLSDFGHHVMSKKGKEKRIKIIERVLSRSVFREALNLFLVNGKMPSTDPVAEIISKNRPELSGSTPRRRASTVVGWIEWIVRQVEW